MVPGYLCAPILFHAFQFILQRLQHLAVALADALNARITALQPEVTDADDKLNLGAFEALGR